MRLSRFALAAAFLWSMTSAWIAPAQAGQPVVWLATADPGGPYAEVVDAVRAELQGVAAEVVAKPWPELMRSEGPAPRIVVAIGVSALRGFSESGPRVPLLATLVPRAAYAGAAAALAGRPHSAVWLDQPAGRQLDLLRLALPGRTRVGVVFGSESRAYENEIQRAAAERGLILVGARSEAPDQLPSALRKALEDADVLLALPDPQVYNGATIQNVLTSTYRQRVPMAGFSPAYVKAGALLALYSTPAQVGNQVGDIVRGFLSGRPLPAPQGPRDFVVGANADVGRSLGIPIDPNAAEKWAEQLRGKERAP
ncbi:MAG: ABC transporter substrate-binding protein [Ignavibacteria bacterium]